MMAIMVCTVRMRAARQWQESKLKELKPCQDSPLGHQLSCVPVTFQSSTGVTEPWNTQGWKGP